MAEYAACINKLIIYFNICMISSTDVFHISEEKPLGVCFYNVFKVIPQDADDILEQFIVI